MCKTRRTHWHIVILVAIAAALVGCQAPLDTRETGPEELYMETIQIPINNCGGLGPVTVHREFSRSIYHDVYVDAGADVHLDTFLISTVLGQRYGFQDGEMETCKTGIDLTAPANTRIVYTLQLNEIWIKGIVYAPASGREQATYRLRKDIGIDIVSTETETCP